MASQMVNVVLNNIEILKLIRWESIERNGNRIFYDYALHNRETIYNSMKSNVINFDLKPFYNYL